MLLKEQIADRFRMLQDDICRQLETADGKGKFLEDNWLRPEGEHALLTDLTFA